VQLPGTSLFLLTQPAFQLFRSVGGAIIEDEGDGLHLAPQSFGNDLLLDKGLEIDKTFASATGTVDLAIGDGEAGKQMACTATMVAGFMQHRLARTCWARRLFALTRLNGGFLIDTQQPVAFLEEGPRLSIGFEHRASSVQESDGIMDMLPGVIAPGTKAFGSEPATDRTC